MTHPPVICERNALDWEVSAFCSTCGHSGWFHPGGGAGQFRQCMICNLSYLEASLIEREVMLKKREVELDALKHEMEYELMRVKAITDGYRPGTWVPTLAHGDVFVP